MKNYLIAFYSILFSCISVFGQLKNRPVLFNHDNSSNFISSDLGSFKEASKKRGSKTIVDTLNYLGFKKSYGSPVAGGIYLSPFLQDDSIKIVNAFQLFDNASSFTMSEVAIPMVALNPNGSAVKVNVYDDNFAQLGSVNMDIAYSASSLTTYWFKFKSPIKITGKFQISIEPVSYEDSVYLPSSGKYRNASLKVDVTGDKLKVISDPANIGSGFWSGQEITGNGITPGTKVIGYNSSTKEFTLSVSQNAPLSGKVIEAVNLTYGNAMGGYLFFSFPLDKTMPIPTPDLSKSPSHSIEAFNWDPVNKDYTYEEDLIMYPVVSYTWNTTPTSTAKCLGTSKTVTVNLTQAAYDNFVKNPMFNRMAFYQKHLGLTTKSKGYYYTRAYSKIKAIAADSLNHDSGLTLNCTYDVDNVNDTLQVVETLLGYGYFKSSSFSQTSTILVSSKLNLSSSITTPITCFGGKGQITVSATGGFSPYTGTGVISNIVAGTKTYTVTGSNGCSASSSIVLTQPTDISMVGVSTPTSGCGATDGKIDVTVSGSVSPYTYKWDKSGSTGLNLTGLAGGTYKLTTTDKNGCVKTKAFIVTATGSPDATATVSKAIACFGGTGEVTVSATGGVPPYTGIGVKTGIVSGDTIFTVVDKNGCATDVEVSVTEPTEIMVDAYVSDSILCFGGDAKVFVSATGGTGSFSGIGELSGEKAGVNTYSVTDANGCPASTVLTVTEPADLIAQATITQDILCKYGLATLDITATGGTAEYIGTGQMYNVRAGVRSYEVEDANGCKATATITVTEPDKLIVERTSIDASNLNTKDGKAIAIVSGGTTPYSYSWKNNDSLSLVISDNKDTITVGYGSYTITVTDKNGCVAKTSVGVDAGTASLTENSLDYRIYPNPISSELNIQLNNTNVSKIELVSIAGQVLETITNLSTETIHLNTDRLENGVYLINLYRVDGIATHKVVKK